MTAPQAATANVGPCPCECNSGGFCGGCGHAGCSNGINLPRFRAIADDVATAADLAGPEPGAEAVAAAEELVADLLPIRRDTTLAPPTRVWTTGGVDHIYRDCRYLRATAVWTRSRRPDRDLCWSCLRRYRG